MITGKTLIEWGFTPAPWFGKFLKLANQMEASGCSEQDIYAVALASKPPKIRTIPLRTNSIPFSTFLEPENEIEQQNFNAVITAMDELMRVPTVKTGVVMPDACPAGVIPVGGVVATDNAIHPGFHSSDVCCSMAITVFKREMDLKKLLDVATLVTHFGPGGRKGEGLFKMPRYLEAWFSNNRFLSDLIDLGNNNLGTQGDGNHFLFVGTLRSTGQPALVTHHGSRGVGAELYKRGMRVAKRHTAIVAPKVPQAASWIDAESDDGRAYWDALQAVRDWTNFNHFEIHDAIQRGIGNAVVDRFWNEHNFVFRKTDGLFYHAKGATPSFRRFSKDDDGRTLIPMNMSEPILITRHANNPEALGFSPHGAGRNMSRTQYLRDPGQWDVETRGLDVRSFLGRPDLSELPSAYKSARQVIDQIKTNKLAEIVDYVDPYGCIMAGTR